MDYFVFVFNADIENTRVKEYYIEDDNHKQIYNRDEHYNEIYIGYNINSVYAKDSADNEYYAKKIMMNIMLIHENHYI